MKRIFEIALVYFIGVLFILTLALRVNQIEKESVSSTSIARNTITLPNNYE